jgi:hypothetical protein
MHVPGRQPGPANHLPGDDALSRPDGRIHVAVAEVTEVNVPANPGWSRLRHDAPFDRVDPVRPAAGGAALRLIVADGDIDALVIDRAVLVVRARVEKRAPDRMLPANRSDRPA